MMLADLVSRLEAATEGSRELDLEIQRTLSGRAWRWNDYFEETITWDEYGPGSVGNPVCSLERFTTSLDAAMTLVPEGWGWDARFLPCEDGNIHEARVNFEYSTHAATVPLALCIAALKARAAP